MEVALGGFDDDDVCDDPTQPPTSAFAYLKRVQEEAAKCPEIVIAEQYRNRPSNHQQETSDQEIINDDVIIDAPLQNIQNQVASSFAHLRQMCIQYKGTNKIDSYIRLPEGNSINEWFKFCYGNSLVKSVNNIDNGHEPLMSIIAQINQPLATKLIGYQYIWLNKYGFHVPLAKWIFSLMLCFDRPTPSDIISHLRNIARKCFQIRNDVTSGGLNHVTDDVVRHLDLIIIIVSKYFGQRDLSF